MQVRNINISHNPCVSTKYCECYKEIIMCRCLITNYSFREIKNEVKCAKIILLNSFTKPTSRMYSTKYYLNIIQILYSNIFVNVSFQKIKYWFLSLMLPKRTFFIYIWNKLTLFNKPTVTILMNRLCMYSCCNIPLCYITQGISVTAALQLNVTERKQVQTCLPQVHG